MAKRKYKRLHYEDRQTIEAMSKQGSSVSGLYRSLTPAGKVKVCTLRLIR